MLPRNSPCPCGSGRKYKHCCLSRDLSESRLKPEMGDPSTQVVTSTQRNIREEFEHIRACALSGDARIVALGALVFFSTETGDAWVIDREDDLAACLMKNEEARDVRLNETETNFSIGWTGKYLLQKQALACTEPSGHATIYTSEIVQALNRMGIRANR